MCRTPHPVMIQMIHLLKLSIQFFQKRPIHQPKINQQILLPSPHSCHQTLQIKQNIETLIQALQQKRRQPMLLSRLQQHSCIKLVRFSTELEYKIHMYWNCGGFLGPNVLRLWVIECTNLILIIQLTLESRAHTLVSLFLQIFNY